MTVRVKVIPRSARTEFAELMGDGTLKVRVAAPPERGRANEELCAFLAAHYRVSRSSVAVVSGQAASLKLVRVDQGNPGGDSHLMNRRRSTDG